MQNYDGYKMIAKSTPHELSLKTQIPIKLAQKVIRLSKSLAQKEK